jgi:choice-of-anchor C domain-containing protein
MIQKLRDTPGEVYDYDNFGYGVLQLVSQRLSSAGHAEYLRSQLGRPFGVYQLVTNRRPGPARESEPARVWNAYGEGSGYPWAEKNTGINYTTPAMCTFMRYFWIDGRPRDNENPTWVKTGGFTNSESLMFWRSDGINIAAAFNGSRDHDGDCWKELDDAITQMVNKKRLPSLPKAPTNLLVNGSFEEGPEVGEFLPLDPGSTVIKGWKVTRGQIDVNGTNVNSADGRRSIDLHGTPGYGGVEQSIRTVKGQRYRVTFSMAGASVGEVPIKRLAVRAAGNKQEFAFDTTGRKLDNLGWVEYAWEFDAVNEDTTIEFHTVMTTDSYCGPYIDNVRVWAVPVRK